MSQLYARVFLKILDSSIAEDYTLRHVFEDLLKLADDGVVDMTREALARRLNIPDTVLNDCILNLESPDHRSRNPEHEGRRIARLDNHRDWGWIILNWEEYEGVRCKEDQKEQTRLRIGRYRANKRASTEPPPAPPPTPTPEAPPASSPSPEGNLLVGYTQLPSVTGSRKPLGVPATEAEAIEWAGIEAVPDDFAKEVFHKCEGVGWIDGVQRPITNFRSYIKHRWVTRQGEAAQGKTQPNGRPLSIIDLQQIVKIKEQRAAELRRKGSSEVATGIVWSDPKLKQEHFAIRTEIKELNARIEQFA